MEGQAGEVTIHLLCLICISLFVCGLGRCDSDFGAHCGRCVGTFGWAGAGGEGEGEGSRDGCGGDGFGETGAGVDEVERDVMEE